MQQATDPQVDNTLLLNTLHTEVFLPRSLDIHPSISISLKTEKWNKKKIFFKYIWDFNKMEFEMRKITLNFTEWLQLLP